MKWIFLYFFDQCLGLDGPYLALLGPLLASQGSDSTPSTRENPDRTPKIIKIHQNQLKSINFSLKSIKGNKTYKPLYLEPLI